MLAFTRMCLHVILASLAIVQANPNEDIVGFIPIADVHNNNIGGRIKVSYPGSNGNIVDREVPVEGYHAVVWPLPQPYQQQSQRDEYQ